PRIVGGIVDMGAHETFGLTIGKVVTPTVVAPGAAISYSLYFHNYHDTDTVSGVQLSDLIPPEVVISEITSEGAAVTQIGAPPAYIWEIEDLEPQAGGIITLTGQVKPEVLSTFNFTNTVSVSARSGDPVADDNSVSVHNHVPGTIYVDAGKTTGANNGASWSDAFTSLQSALDIAHAGHQIWVAEGVYTPSQRSEKNDPRSATFKLIGGVALYGGFAGIPGQEGDLSLRDWQAYPTVLSGDIDGNDLVDERGVLTTTANL
ncbi:MAG: DUF11 domain-containing protein, partial [Gammaproteobacteria bacterium]|nr:DUF11 domain-containing protein [Gammaproteobacteria bacterium]